MDTSVLSFFVNDLITNVQYIMETFLMRTLNQKYESLAMLEITMTIS